MIRYFSFFSFFRLLFIEKRQTGFRRRALYTDYNIPLLHITPYLFLQHCAPPDVRFKFGRSNSHSHSSGRSGKKSNSTPSVDNMICHKSLPDLHTSTRRRASLSPRASTKLSAKQSGHHQAANNCPDCETSSDYSDHSFKRDAVCYRR